MSQGVDNSVKLACARHGASLTQSKKPPSGGFFDFYD